MFVTLESSQKTSASVWPCSLHVRVCVCLYIYIHIERETIRKSAIVLGLYFDTYCRFEMVGRRKCLECSQIKTHCFGS